MSKKKRARRASIPVGKKAPTRGAIPAPGRPPIDRYVIFSFKYLDLGGNPKFSLDHAPEGYPEELLRQFKQVSAMDIAVFRKAVDSLHSHAITFEETTEAGGFSLHRQLWEGSEWQFASGKIARAHGFIVQNVFHIIWLDPTHKLYKLTSRG